MSDFVCVTNVV